MLDPELLTVFALVILPALLLAEGLVVLLVWGNRGGGMPWLVARWRAPGRSGVSGAAVAWWLLWTTLTGLAGWLVSFVGVNWLLMHVGSGAAWGGFLGSIALIAALPVVWAVVMDRRDRHARGGR